MVGTATTQYIWIGGDAYTAVAVAKKVGTGSWTVYNIFRDHLGSITHMKTGSTVTEYSFDAWGRRRNPTNWSYDLTSQPELLADRGFTSHEYLKYFNLYNMNGRMYDPLVGRFLNVDPYVQMPDYTQNINRYSYALNNPLKYTDPDGEIIFTILAAVFCPPLIPLGIAMDVGGIINTASNWGAVKNGFNNNAWSGIGKMFGFYGVGGGQVAATYYLGPLGTIGSSYGGDALNSLLTDGTVNSFSFESTTMSLGTELLVGQIGIGNKAGDVVSKLFKKEMSRKLISNLVSQNVDGIISEIGISSWQNQSLEDGIKIGLSNYSRNWWKYSLSGLSQGYMEAKDKRTQQKEDYAEKAKEYYKKNSTMTGFEFKPKSWIDAIYDFQIVISPALDIIPTNRKNNRLYSPARNY